MESVCDFVHFKAEVEVGKLGQGVDDGCRSNDDEAAFVYLGV